MAFTGSCHCGNIRYRAVVAPLEAMSCNCSICRRKGYLLLFTSSDNFQLETPRDAIAVYTFKTHNIRHQFCKTCGCAPFGEGKGPDGATMVAINLRCVDDLDLGKVKVTEVDGASLP